MLVLSRQKNQSIVLGDDIWITIVDIRGDKVRLGINAPREVPVHREEIYEIIKNTESEKKKLEEKAGGDSGKGTSKSPSYFLNNYVENIGQDYNPLGEIPIMIKGVGPKLLQYERRKY
jgi:carbon storage regulator